MKVLKIEQNGHVESFANLKAVFINNKYEFVSTSFDIVAKRFPECLIDIKENDFPPWGYAFYRKNEEGMLELFKENWDTSG